MPLATQCPHCLTTFRVANDQLKLHAGLVRCGACQQTFNGVEHLLAPGAKPAPAKSLKLALAPGSFEVPAHEATHLPAHLPIHVPLPDELEAPASATPVDSATLNQNENASAEPIQEAHPISSPSSLDFDLGQDDAFAQNEAAPAETPAAEVQAPEIEKPEAQSETVVFDVEQDDAKELEAQQEISTITATVAETIEASAGADEVEPEMEALVESEMSEEGSHEASDAAEHEGESDSEKPIFVIQAEKKQRRSRITKIFLLLFSVILFLAFLGQASYGMRHQIAARFPQTKPALQEACKLLRCRIETPAQIDMILIESNELQALVTDGNIFSLTALLQNTSATLQAWPMLELTLNDSKEQTVLRRVFTPSEYLSNKNDLIKGFAPASEQTIKLHFELSEVKAAGYHLSVFYP